MLFSIDMKARTLILLLLITAMTGCLREPLPEADSDLGLYIEFPGPSLTRAEGELPATTEENTIHSLIVWVFRSDSHEKVAALQIPASEIPSGGGVRRYSLPVSRDFANAKPDVDVFILANAASINAGGLNENSDWTTLNNRYFGDNTLDPYHGFGIANPVHAVDASLGLPMSGCAKNQHVLGDEPSLRVPTVQIGRMVSRLRFVFCKTRTEGGGNEDISIQNVILKAYQIPKKEYLFTTGNTGVVKDQAQLNDNYIESAYIQAGPANIAENDTPEKLVYVNQDPQAYDQMLSDAVAAGELTDLGYTYLRESDIRLIGTIQYTIAGQQREREFDMAAPGDFARNHTWTVFGYFLSGRNLQLSLKVMPWDYNIFDIDFSEESVNVSSKFTVEDDNNVEMEETSKDHFNVKLLPGKAAKGHLHITTPRGGNLMIQPKGDAYAFKVTPEMATIDPSNNSGRVDIEIRRNPDLDEDLTGKYITLSFSVEAAGGRLIDADTEAIDKEYKFIL